MPYIKINSKWTIGLKAKITKLLEENLEVNLCDLELSSDFLAMTPKVQATTTK